MSKKTPKTALVHDFLLKLGGGERVLKVFADMFPDAPIYTLLYDEKSVGSVFPKERVRPSSLQKLPSFIRKRQKYLLPKMPGAIEEMDFGEFDIVLSSNSAFSHGIITNTDTKHICYCHSPMRYAWDWTHEYVKEQNVGRFKKAAIALLLKKIRMWDQIAADRVDKYIANSKTVRNRIMKYYRKDAEIIYPPVDVNRFKPQKKKENFFLIVSTITPYKKIDLAVQLFNKLGKELVIIGDGPQKPYLQSIAGPNISFLGFKSDRETAQYYQNARAFIFPGEEDFGITPVEAMAAGTPVLAYGKGGVTETVIPGVTGEFFNKPTVDSMGQGLAKLLTNEKNYSVTAMRDQAEKFSQERFIKEIEKAINN
ncbi:glycosyltransferase family 4 protein [bacterium]|nr:glycosyltransferase family 4 protein [bacterium]